MTLRYPRDLRKEKFHCSAVIPSAIKGIQWRREKLEQILEPFLTTEKTDTALHFRGLDFYLVMIEDSELYGQVILAAQALQFAYRVLDAIETGEVKHVERFADSVMGFWACDSEFSGRVMFGVGWWE